jgi:hypothetical protein
MMIVLPSLASVLLGRMTIPVVRCQMIPVLVAPNRLILKPQLQTGDDCLGTMK